MAPKIPEYLRGGTRWTCLVEVCREGEYGGWPRWEFAEVTVKTNFDEDMEKHLEKALQAPYKGKLIAFDLRVAEVVRPVPYKVHSTDLGGDQRASNDALTPPVKDNLKFT